MLTLFISLLATANARNINEEKSTLMLESENFWQRELQGSAGPGGGGPGGGGPGGGGPGGGGPGGLPCGLDANTRRNQILGTLRGTVSANNALNSPGSPQNLASNWLINEDDFEVCPGDEKIVQRYVMALFYFSTDGSAWSQCGQVGPCGGGGKSFLSDKNECEWSGITCNNDDCVTEIVFESNNVGGSLPTELAQLNDLEVISLEQGTLASTIPAQLGSLSNLRIIDLDFNMLTGRIPESIYGLTNLEQLDLNSNKLIGTLSNNVGNLQELRLIQLYENLMVGTVPNSLGSLDNLVIAEFFNNTFTGTMPQSVCDNRAPPAGTGAITGLTSDCFPGPVPQIECSCCTGCAVF